MKKFLGLFIAVSFILIFPMISCAFLEDVPEEIERELQVLIEQAKDGDTGSNRKLHRELNLYQSLDLSRHSKDEILSRIEKLISSGNFPEYVLERGEYSYTPNQNYLYLSGRNVNMYSHPVLDSSLSIAKFNSGGVDYLINLGEWKTQSGLLWVFAQSRETGITGWLERRNVHFVPNYKFQDFISDITSGLAGYNVTTIQETQKGSEAINSAAVNYNNYTKNLERNILADIKLSKSGSINAKAGLRDRLDYFNRIAKRPAFAKKSWHENDAYTQQLIKQKKISGHLFRAGYKYDESGIVIITPDAANIRQEPDADSKRLAGTKPNTPLRYLGERLNKQGEKWYLVDDNKGNIGWVIERVIEIIPIEAVKFFADQIEKAL